MRALAEARRHARIHHHRAAMSVGDRALPAPGTLGTRENALCPQDSGRGHEQAHHLDALLRTAGVLWRIQTALYTRAFSRSVCVCTSAISDVGARETPALTRLVVASG